MSEFNQKHAILVTIAENSSMLDECERSLDELERLLNTAGGECFSKVIQINPLLFLRKFHETDHSHPTVTWSPKSYHTEYTIVIS